MSRKYKFILSGIALFVFLFWADVTNISGFESYTGNLNLLLYLGGFVLIGIGLRSGKSKDLESSIYSADRPIPGIADKNSKCPHCDVEGKNRDIYHSKGKDQKKFVMRCKSCDGGVYLDWNGVPSKIPTAEWERIRELDRREGRS